MPRVQVLVHLVECSARRPCPYPIRTKDTLMAPPPGSPITFIVPGQTQRSGGGAPPAATRAPLPAGLPRGEVIHSVRVATQRDAGGEVRVAAMPGEDVVVLHVADGPVLVLHPEHARDLLLAQGEL